MKVYSIVKQLRRMTHSWAGGMDLGALMSVENRL